MDYLEILSEQFKGNIKSQEHQSYNFKEISYRRLIIKNYKQYKIEVDDFGSLFAIKIKANSDLAFSINNPDKLFLFDTPVSIKGLPYNVFVSEDNSTLLQNECLNKFWNSIIDLSGKIKFYADETVFFYKNHIYFALHSDRNLIPIVDEIVDLVDANTDIFKKNDRRVISSKKVPANLKPLLPLLKKYSLSDDAEREELIDKMKKSQKIKIIKTVEPLMHEINHYLDSFKDSPLSEEAILIGNLAELVSELMIKKPG
jgi:hypothetical protein